MPDLFQLPEAVQTPWPLAPSPSRAEMLLLFFSCLSCPTVYDPMDCGTPDFPVLHHLPEFAQSHVLWDSDAIQPSHLSSVTPFSSCPQSFPASASFPLSWLFAPTWPKFWSFSFSIGSSSEYPGLSSFRIDWFYLLADQGTLKSLPLEKGSNGIFKSLSLSLPPPLSFKDPVTTLTHPKHLG